MANLQGFKEATLFFSSSTPNLAQVIPAMDLVDQRLATAVASPETYNPAIRTACELAKITLNKYYSLSDASKLYRIAMSMRPFSLLSSTFRSL